MNEKQLSIGETTIGGRPSWKTTKPVPDRRTGAHRLERTRRRERSRLIGQLVKQYGYGDSGECITIADKKEVWHFEIMGRAHRDRGVWAAVRIRTTTSACLPTFQDQ